MALCSLHRVVRLTGARPSRQQGMIALARAEVAAENPNPEGTSGDDRFRTLLEKSPIATCIVDLSGFYIYVNPAMCALYDYAAAEMIGHHCTMVVPEERRSQVADLFAERVAQEADARDEVVVRTRGGRLLTILSTTVPLVDEAGAVTLASFNVDITERTRAERTLRQREERFRALSEYATDLVAITTGEGSIRYASPSHERILGHQPGALQGTQIFAYLHPEDLPGLLEALLAPDLAHNPPPPQTLRMRHTDGSWRWLELVVRDRRDDPAVEGLIINAHDVTDRVSFAEELRLQAAEAEALAGISAALGSTLEPQALYALILEHASRSLAYDHAEVVLYDGSAVVVAANRGEPCVPPGTVLGQFADSARRWVGQAGGEPVFVPDTERLDGWSDLPPWQGAWRIRSLIAIPLIINGAIVGSFMCCNYRPQDYSQRQGRIVAAIGERIGQAVRNARLYAAEQERRRAAEALAALRNDFVAAVSHELRTPLTAITGYAELLSARWTQLDDIRRLEQLEKIVASAGRLRRLIDDLLLVSQLESTGLAPLLQPSVVATIVSHAAQEARGSYLGQRITIVGPDEVRVVADPDRAVQIVSNLLDNAAKYSPEGAPIAVQWAVDGQMVAVRVRDYGTGIPEEARDRLFTRFGRVPGSRIRAGRTGTGLGLFLGRQLAEAMHGDLELESTSPGGTTFRLRLPLYQE